MAALMALHNSLGGTGWRSAAISHRSHPVTCRRIRAERVAFVNHGWVFDRY